MWRTVTTAQWECSHGLAPNTDSPAQHSGWIIIHDKYKACFRHNPGQKIHIKAWDVLPLSSGKNTMKAVCLIPSLPFIAKFFNLEGFAALSHVSSLASVPTLSLVASLPIQHVCQCKQAAAHKVQNSSVGIFRSQGVYSRSVQRLNNLICLLTLIWAAGIQQFLQGLEIFSGRDRVGHAGCRHQYVSIWLTIRILKKCSSQVCRLWTKSINFLLTRSYSSFPIFATAVQG